MDFSRCEVAYTHLRKAVRNSPCPCWAVPMMSGGWLVGAGKGLSDMNTRRKLGFFTPCRCRFYALAEIFRAAFVGLLRLAVRMVLGLVFPLVVGRLRQSAWQAAPRDMGVRKSRSAHQLRRAERRWRELLILSGPQRTGSALSAGAGACCRRRCCGCGWCRPACQIACRPAPVLRHIRPCFGSARCRRPGRGK